MLMINLVFCFVILAHCAMSAGVFIASKTVEAVPVEMATVFGTGAALLAALAILANLQPTRWRR